MRVECPERAKRVEGHWLALSGPPTLAHGKPWSGRGKNRINVIVLGWDLRWQRVGKFFVYILRCADGTYYVGSASGLGTRVQTHNTGLGLRFTACRRPVVLVYSESFDTMDSARQREIQLKKWSRAKKEAPIAGSLDALHNLSRRRKR